MNNDVTWNGLGQTGYGRALGTWNHYGGTGGYDLDVRVRNNSTGYTEVSTVSSITSGSVVVSTGYSSITVNVYANNTWMDFSTETTGSSGSTGGGCSAITIIRGTDGGYTVDVGDCLSAQKSSQPSTKAASDCPGDDGEVGVVTTTTLIYLRKNLNLPAESPEYQYLSGDLSPKEEEQVLKLEVFLRNNTTTEAKQFGLEVLRAFMTGGKVDWEEQVILDKEFVENDCLYGVYTAMGKATKFKEYLQNFDNNFTNPVANLRLTTGVHPVFPNASAVTDPPENYLIQIMFNPNQLNRPSIDVARTMIHEMIHAEMYRKLLSIAKQPNIPWTENFILSLRNDYKGLADYYTRYWLKLPLDQQPGEPQHELMAEHFIEIIEQVLRDYDDSLTDIQYEALAWVGLKGGSVLDKDTGLPTNPTVAWENELLTKRLLLNATYENFKANNSNCQ